MISVAGAIIVGGATVFLTIWTMHG